MNIRALANAERRRLYLVMLGRHLLYPTAASTVREDLVGREHRYVPGVYFTPTWTPEARAAFYNLPR